MSELTLLAAQPLRNSKPEKEWLSRKEAALYLDRIGCPMTARNLEKKAANNNAGKGPPFSRVGWKAVRYKRIDLDVWAKAQTVRIA
jgi:hypothetical protein